MKKSKVIFLALLACAFGASAGTAVGRLNGVEYDSLDKMIEAAQGMAEAEIVMYTNASLSAYLNCTNQCIIRGRDAQCVISAEGKAGFRIPTGGSLTISNIVFSGYVDEVTDDDHGFILIDGGELTLDDGAVLDGMVGHVYRGSGIIDLNKGEMTMKSGVSVVNCRAEGGIWYDAYEIPQFSGGFGGAIYVCGRDCTLNLQGGIISNCYASLGCACGGGVYVGDDRGNPRVSISGKLKVACNRSASEDADNIFLSSHDLLSGFKLVGVLDGSVGIRYDDDEGNAEGKPFMTNAVGAVSADTLKCFFNDTDATLEAATNANGLLVWVPKVDDGTCDEDQASAHVCYPDDTVRHYTNLVTAVAHMTNGTTARIEMRCENPSLPKHNVVLTPITLPADCHLTLTAGESGYRVRRHRSASITIPSGTSLVVTNLVMDSSNPRSVTNAFLIVDGGALTLADGACVSNIVGNASSDAAAIFVCNRGTITMEAGSRIYGCQNTNNYDMVFETGVNYGCGGGILLNNATAYLEGGEIADCLATRGGGVYACGGSAVHVSGDTRIAGNEWLNTNGVRSAGNVYVAEGSELVLKGPLTGKIGKGAEYYVGGAGDANLVATVGYVWTNDVEALAMSAANFVHDVTAENGVAVTNGTDALIVWCGAVKDGVYTNASDGAEYKAVGYEPPAGAELLPALSSASGISSELSKLNDTAVGANLSTLEEYNAFASWATSVEGGKEAVRDSAHAYESYEFGATNLFENTPVVEITEAIGADGGLTVSVVVKDGEDAMAVASAKVKDMFEGTTDFGDWATDSKKLDLAADGVTTDLTNATEKKVEFTIKPVGNPSRAFIRLKY